MRKTDECPSCGRKLIDGTCPITLEVEDFDPAFWLSPIFFHARYKDGDKTSDRSEDC